MHKNDKKFARRLELLKFFQSLMNFWLLQSIYLQPGETSFCGNITDTDGMDPSLCNSKWETISLTNPSPSGTI